MTNNSKTSILQDPQRLGILEELGVLETSFVEALDRLTRLISKITNSPVSLVSIVDADRQFFKSLFGLPEPLASERETPLSHSFCQHVVTSNEPLIVEDAREVELLKDNLAISDLNVIAYLGMPLTTSDGTCLGSFCVIDSKPRKWTESEIEIIRELATSVMTEIELAAEIKAHERSKAHLETVFRHTPLILYSLDKDGRFTLSEGMGLEAIGRKPGEVVGESVFEIYKDNPVILNGVRHAFKGDANRLTTAVGSLIYDAWYEPIFDEKNQVTGVVGLANDITAVKAAEQNLHRHIFEQSSLNDIALAISSQTEFPKLVDTLAIKINQLLNGQLTSISIFNSEKESREVIAIHDPLTWPEQSHLIGRSYKISHLPQEMLDQVIGKGKAIWINKDPRIQELRGEVAYISQTRSVSSIMIIPLLSRADVIGGIFVSFADQKREISSADIQLAETVAQQAASAIHNARLYEATQKEIAERIQAEEELEKSLRYEETLAKCASELLVTGERKANLDAALKALQEGLKLDRVFLGSNRKTDGGRLYIDWAYEVTAPSIPPVDKKLKNKPYFLPNEWFAHLQNPEGLPIPGGDHLGDYHTYFQQPKADYSCYMLPIGLQDQWYGVLGLVKGAPLDFWSQKLVKTLQTAAKMIHAFLDRRKNYEELAEAHQQALSANRLKNQILAKVSHELKTPLSAILGYSELMQMGIYGPVVPQQVEILSEMVDSTGYLNALVNELLQQARLDASELKLEASAFKLSGVFAHVQSNVGVLATQKDIGLNFSIAPQLSPEMHNDPVRLQQILMNLVSNAIKFTETGLIQVLASPIDEKTWRLEVKDTGVGIPQEAHKRIFEPFQQVDGTASRASGGTGLGLSITKQLISLMGGDIMLESTVGKGSTFTITMPYVIGVTNK